MKKLFNKSFLIGLVSGIVLASLSFIPINKYFLREPDIHEQAAEMAQEMMLGVQGTLTAEQYRDVEIRCYYENLYGYARDWNVIDSTMTFEEFCKHPLCNRDSIQIRMQRVEKLDSLNHLK